MAGKEAGHRCASDRWAKRGGRRAVQRNGERACLGNRPGASREKRPPLPTLLKYAGSRGSRAARRDDSSACSASLKPLRLPAEPLMHTRLRSSLALRGFCGSQAAGERMNDGTPLPCVQSHTGPIWN
ncbi:hypothetical protein P7K49_033859 [Saguinus oedipus]|uniref:Uncharacterized protein n=1 Tax=Saguinus oedipus TaxID=9490 RepID=A0ABQ9TUY4_SAGOE|nr:hypothetical protein P7K49_033859 [Saguinus oedipus]